jgi:hypothetical protein
MLAGAAINVAEASQGRQAAISRVRQDFGESVFIEWIGFGEVYGLTVAALAA